MVKVNSDCFCCCQVLRPPHSDSHHNHLRPGLPSFFFKSKNETHISWKSQVHQKLSVDIFTSLCVSAFNMMAIRRVPNAVWGEVRNSPEETFYEESSLHGITTSGDKTPLSWLGHRLFLAGQHNQRSLFVRIIVINIIINIRRFWEFSNFFRWDSIS